MILASYLLACDQSVIHGERPARPVEASSSLEASSFLASSQSTPHTISGPGVVSIGEENTWFVSETEIQESQTVQCGSYLWAYREPGELEYTILLFETGPTYSTSTLFNRVGTWSLAAEKWCGTQQYYATRDIFVNNPTP
ncbi:hypothetical protein BH23BAC4_BH23BAC4_13730 [soil metagenome]